MRLIDADALRDLMEQVCWDRVEMRAVQKTIDEQPTIDPVKHGKWIERERYRTTKDGVFHTYRYKVCSICGRASGRRMNKRTRYCPHCGARMDLGEE